MAEKITYTENDRAIVSALKGSEGLTLAQLREATGLNLVAGHIVGAMRKGLIEAIGETEIVRNANRKVCTYSFVTADALSNGDKPFNYTDGEKVILDAASRMEGAFTLAQLAESMNVAKVYSGSINGLVKKGNIAKGDQITLVVPTKSTVKVYGFKADIPQE